MVVREGVTHTITPFTESRVTYFREPFFPRIFFKVLLFIYDFSFLYFFRNISYDFPLFVGWTRPPLYPQHISHTKSTFTTPTTDTPDNTRFQTQNNAHRPYSILTETMYVHFDLSSLSIVPFSITQNVTNQQHTQPLLPAPFDLLFLFLTPSFSPSASLRAPVKQYRLAHTPPPHPSHTSSPLTHTPTHTHHRTNRHDRNSPLVCFIQPNLLHLSSFRSSPALYSRYASRNSL